MARHSTFTFRVSPYEKLVIAKIAKHLQRSKADALRYLIRNYWLELEPSQVKPQGNKVDSNGRVGN